MKLFTLTHTYITGPDEKVTICLKPSDSTINEYIATYKGYSSEKIADLELLEFIDLMTPILFSEFQQMDNIPSEIRNSFYL